MSLDCTTLGEASLVELFCEGKIAIACGQARYVLESERKDNFQFMSTLGVTDGNHEVMSFSPVDTMCVNSSAKNMDAAVALLKFLISSDSRDIFRADCYPTLVQMNASAAPITYDNESISACMAEAGTHTRTMPVCKGVNSMVESIMTNLQLMMLNELSPEKALEAMQSACTAALNSKTSHLASNSNTEHAAACSVFIPRK